MRSSSSPRKGLLQGLLEKLTGGPEKHANVDHVPLFSYDIVNVVNNIDVLDENFVFLGVFSIDEEEPYMLLRTIDYAGKAKSREKLAVVWNTDVIGGPGLHWIALFINFENRDICFFDSLAEETPYQIVELMKKLRVLAPKYSVKINTRPYQTKESGNCGVFVLYFIMSMLQGETCENWINSREQIDDQLMKVKRKEMFG